MVANDFQEKIRFWTEQYLLQASLTFIFTVRGADMQTADLGLSFPEGT
jgi:hypothetical protein